MVNIYIALSQRTTVNLYFANASEKGMNAILNGKVTVWKVLDSDKSGHSVQLNKTFIWLVVTNLMFQM